MTFYDFYATAIRYLCFEKQAGREGRAGQAGGNAVCVCGKQGKTLENSVRAFEKRRHRQSDVHMHVHIHIHIQLDVDVDVVPRVERELKNRI